MNETSSSNSIENDQLNDDGTTNACENSKAVETADAEGSGAADINDIGVSLLHRLSDFHPRGLVLHCAMEVGFLPFLGGFFLKVRK